MTQLPPLVDTVATREVLHRVAEDVMAAEQFAAIHKLGLQATGTGFATRWFPADDGERRLVVAGSELVRETRASSVREPIAGLDPRAAEVLYAWWQLGDRTLADVVLAAGEKVSPIVLWPEHFDIAVTVTLASGASVNLGFSPGDDFSPEPYAYVGPWEPAVGPFWNAPFGAYRTYREIQSADAASFLADGLAQLR
jgi:hypothetical protein